MYKQELNIPELEWQPYKNLPMVSIPQAVCELLLNSLSLTQYLQQRAKQSFHVEVINSGWLYASPSEIQSLGIMPREKTWVREVFLRCDGEIAIYAWSVFPESTLVGKYKGLQRLGNKSLGKILFGNPHVERTDFEIARIPNDHSLYQKITRELTEKPEYLWARRSCFQLEGRPLLVNEVFLPFIFSI